MIRLLALLSLFVSAVFAQTVDGTYVFTQEGHAGNPVTMTFRLQTAGSTLSGTVTSASDAATISWTLTNGSVSGNSLNFDITPSGDAPIHYDGTLSGDGLSIAFVSTLTRASGRQSQAKLTAKKQ